MKIFQSTIKYFEIIGITPESHRFNEKILMNISIFLTLIVLCCAYLPFEADNLKDYTESIYLCSAFITSSLAFLFLIWKKEYIFKFIDDWEEITENSK